MKKLAITSVAVFTALVAAYSDSSELKLKLSCKAQTLRVGEADNIYLGIEGGIASSIFRDTEGISAPRGRLRSFATGARFEPQSEGKFILGPYSLSFEGQQLSSNEIEIEVLPAWDGRLGTFFRVNRERISLGEEFELVMESWEEDYVRKEVYLQNDDSFAWSQGFSRTSSSRSQAGTLHSYRTSWLIKPTTAGQFKVSKEIFREFPEGIEMPEFVILVEE